MILYIKKTLQLFQKIALAAVFLSNFVANAQLQNMVGYTGGIFSERFHDVLQLSDGTFLVGGQATDLTWLPSSVQVTEMSLPANNKRNYSPDLPVNSNAGTRAFILHLSSDFKTIIRCLAFPPNTVRDVFKIKTTSAPGQPTGAIYISGSRDNNPVGGGNANGYYVARLNNNFVNGIPTGCEWVYDVDARNRGGAAELRFPPDVESIGKQVQPWDVSGDGSVIYATGHDFSNDVAGVDMIDANGNARGYTGLLYHELNNGTVLPISPSTNYINTTGNPALDVRRSTIWFKLARTSFKGGRLRSWTMAQYDTLMEDENGNPGRKGKFPLDALFAGPEPLEGPVNELVPGYLGTAFSGSGNAFTARVSAVTFNKITGDFYIGFSARTSTPNNIPGVTDTEPAVAAFRADGTLKWWARLLPENTENSPIQQHVDGLAIDYSTNQLVVLGRCRGDVTNNFWRGNELKNKPGGNGFQNRLTGTINNANNAEDFSWLGKYGENDGKIYHSTYIAEYAPSATFSSSSPLANLDGFASPNSGNYQLANTYVNSITTDANGNIYIIGKAGERFLSTQIGNNNITTGARTITTASAYQKMTKPNFVAGPAVPANSFFRVYNASLDTLIYSSLLAGDWDKSNNNAATNGGNSTVLRGIYPINNGVVVTGYYTTSITGPTTGGRAVPTTDTLPTWSSATPIGSDDALFAKIDFDCATPSQPSAISIAPNTPHCSGTRTYSIAPVAGAYRYEWVLENTTGWSLSATTGLSVDVTAPTASTGGILKVYAINACGRSLEQQVQLPTSTTVGAISQFTLVRPDQHCSGTLQTYSLPPVNGATSYQWSITGTGWSLANATTSESNVSITAGTGTATLEVTASNGCATSSSQTFTLDASPLPAQPSFVNPDDTTICLNIAKVFRANPSLNAISYTWTIPTGWSANSLNTTLPEITLTATNNNSGVLSIVAVNSCGNSAATSINIDAPLNLSKPAVPAISGPAAVCANSTGTYTATPLPNAVGYEWAVTGPNSIITDGSTTNTTVVSYNATGNGNSTLTVRAFNQCGFGETAVLPFRRNLPDRPSRNIEPNIVPCIGDTITYTTLPGNGAESYVWDWQSGGANWQPMLPDTVSQTEITLSPSVGATSGILRVRSLNQCGISGNSRSVNLAEPGLFAQVNLEVIPSSSNAQCSGQALIYYVSASDTTGITNFQWILPTGWSALNASTEGIPNDTVILVATANAQGGVVVVKSVGACGSTTFQLPDPKGPSKPTITGPTSVCSNAPNTNYTVQNIIGANYEWQLIPSNAGILVGNGFVNTVNWNDGFSGTAQIIARVSNLCGASPYDTLLVTVNLSPKIALNDTLVTPANCGTNDGSISGVKVYGNGTNYEWLDLGGAVIGSGTLTTDSISLSLTNRPTGFYKLRATIGSCVSVTPLILVPGVNVPNPPLAQNPSAYCDGDTIQPLTATGSGIKLKWYADAGLTNLLATGNSFTPTGTIQGTVTFYVVDSSATCESAPTPVEVTVRPKPIVTDSAIITLAQCQGAPGSINGYTATASFGTTAPSYTWRNVITNAIVGNTPDLVANGGIYRLTIDIDNQCPVVLENDTIRVFGAPVAPQALGSTNIEQCIGTTAQPLSAIDTLVNKSILWFRNPQLTIPVNAALISTSNSNTVDIDTSSVNVNSLLTSAGLYKFYAVAQNLAASNCLSLPTEYTILVKSSPNASFAISASDTVFCSGDSAVSLIPTVSGGTFSGTGVSGTSFTPANTGTTPITISISYKLTVAGCSDSSSQNVIVRNLPTAPVVTAAGATTFCQGDSVVLNANTALNATIWSSITTDTTNTITVKQAGTYTARTFDSFGCVSDTSNNITVTVNALPTTPTINGALIACDTTTLTSSVSGSGYIWTNVTGNTQNVGLNASANNITVRVISAQGCTSAVSAPVDVVINTTPAVPTITASGDVAFCEGGSVTLTSSAATGNIWSNTATTQSVIVFTSDTITVQAQANGCTSAVSSPVVVTVNPLPATPTINGALTACDTTTLTSSVSGSSYIWTNVTGNTQNVGLNASANNITVRVISAQGCTSAVSAPVDVVINTTPTAPTLNSSTICQGESASLSLPLADTYLWSNGATTQAITISNVGTTTVSAQIVVSGCTSAVSNSATIVVNAKPIVDIVANPGTTVKKGEAFTLTASGATTYSWNTGATSNAIELRGEEVGTFTYSVIGTSNGCASDAKEIVIIVELKELRIPTGFSPNNDGVNDTWQIEGLEKFPTALIEVFNRYGTKVFSREGGHNTEEVWTGDKLPAGTYYFVIDTKDQTEGKKTGTLTIVR